jgi:hypothetical protein
MMGTWISVAATEVSDPYRFLIAPQTRFVNSLSANDLLNMKMKRTDFLAVRDDEEKFDLI